MEQPKNADELLQILSESKSLNQAYNLGAMFGHMMITCGIREAVAGMALATCLYDLLGRCTFPDGAEGKPVPVHTRPHEVELSAAIARYMARESVFLAKFDHGDFTDPQPMVPKEGGPVQ